MELEPGCHPFLRSARNAGRAGFSPVIPRSMGVVALLAWTALAGPASSASAQSPSGTPATSADWWAKAADSIDRHRRSNLTVDLRDPAGFPVGGMEVEVRHLRHEFHFGTVVDGALLTSPDADRYREVLAGGFNAVTAGPELEWGPVEADPAPALAALGWSADRSLPVRAAGLLWPSEVGSPSPAPDLSAALGDPAALGRRVEGHLTKVLGQVGGKVVEWDVTVPPPDATVGPTRSLLAGWLRTARGLDPEAGFGLGRAGVFGAGDSTAAVRARQDAEAMRELGGPLDYIALHLDGVDPHLSPAEMTGLLDAASGVYTATWAYPLRLTDFDAGGLDEASQAARVREVLTVAFAHPSVTAIHASGFWEGGRSAAGKALFRRDWSPKPAAVAWSNLVHSVWTTRTNIRAQVNGRATVRAFRGDLEVTVRMPGTNVTTRVRLAEDATVRVTVPPLVPALTVTPGDLFDYTWPRSANGFRLEVATDPVKGPWQMVEGFALPAGNRWRVQLPGPDATEYYRLHRAAVE